jgi:hypothetical protein
MTAADLHALHLALPVGIENGTTQADLAAQLGWDTRKVQEGFLELRREHHVPVVALTCHNGCFIARKGDKADLAAIKRTRNSMNSRAMSLHVTVRDLDEVIADLEWSPCLFPELEEVAV